MLLELMAALVLAAGVVQLIVQVPALRAQGLLFTGAARAVRASGPRAADVLRRAVWV